MSPVVVSVGNGHVAPYVMFSMGRFLLTELLLLYPLLLTSTLSMYCEIAENQTCVVLTVLNKCDVFHILVILQP